MLEAADGRRNNQAERIFGRRSETPAGIRQASTRIGKPIRLRARDWQGFFDWAGSCRCVAAIKAFVTRGGGAADASNKSTTNAG
jgi:hypothetical protein